MKLKYRTVILDVDSTLSSIEGIEWLARSRGAEVFARVSDVTERAMRGELEFDGVYAARLDAVRPTRDEIGALGEAYIQNISPGALEVVRKLKAAGAAIHIVSGGLREPVLHLAAHLGIPDSNVHAVPVFFDDGGGYAGYDLDHPCSKQLGKRAVISLLQIERPSIIVGDGMTDAEVKPGVDAFAAFTAVVRREAILSFADFEVSSFRQLFAQITE